MISLAFAPLATTSIVALSTAANAAAILFI